jgi:hypothetical protein
MITTVEKAKTKLCPLVSNIVGGGCRALCLGDECMLWQWSEYIYKNKESGRQYVADGEIDDPNYEKMPARGYCGLAGRP